MGRILKATLIGGAFYVGAILGRRQGWNAARDFIEDFKATVAQRTEQGAGKWHPSPVPDQATADYRSASRYVEPSLDDLPNVAAPNGSGGLT